MKYFLFTSMEQMLTSTVYEGINFSGPHKRDYELSLYIKLPVFSESVVIHNKNFRHSEVPVCPIVSL